jgi:ABC-2 type transport system permease protein
MSGLAGFWALAVSETKKRMIERARYLGDTVSSIITIYVVFLGIFYGFRGLAGPALPETRLEVLILVYLSWLFALTALQTFSTEVSEEMQRGTLEQLYLSPYGIWSVLVARAVVELVWSFVLVGVILVLIMATTGVWVPVVNGSAIAAILLAIPGLWGVGIAFGGLILINKRAQGLLQILNFALIGLVALNAYPFNATALLPFSAGAATVRAILLEGAALTPGWAAYLAGSSLVYLVIGVVAYRLFERAARRRNLLGQY